MLSLLGAQDQFLVRDLRSHKPHSMTNKSKMGKRALLIVQSNPLIKEKKRKLLITWGKACALIINRKSQDCTEYNSAKDSALKRGLIALFAIAKTCKQPKGPSTNE